MPYGPPTAAGIKVVLDRIYRYLDGVTPAALIDRSTGRPLDEARRADTNSIFAPGDFRRFVGRGVGCVEGQISQQERHVNEQHQRRKALHSLARRSGPSASPARASA